MTADDTTLKVLLEEFHRHLERRDRSTLPIRAYLSDLHQFAA